MKSYAVVNDVRSSTPQRSERRKGFVMVMMAVSMVMLLGAFGLAFDIGRALIAKNEAQAFTDAASLAATIHLNGTNSGIDNAKNAVGTTSNKWMMGTKTFTSVTTEFSPDKVTWETNPVNVVNTKYVRVAAPANFVTMHMLSAVGVPQTLNAPARSVAGFQLPTSFPQGVFPFAPLAKANAKPHFGYKKGDELTLLWPSSVGSNGQSVKMNNLCAVDQSPEALQAMKVGSNSERGYIMENSADAIREAIEDDHMDYTVAEGQVVDRTTGVKNTD